MTLSSSLKINQLAFTLCVALLMALSQLPKARATILVPVFVTIHLSIDQPVRDRSDTRLISISKDGIVRIRVADKTTYTARAGECFRDSFRRRPPTNCTLVSANPSTSSVVILYLTPSYHRTRPRFMRSPYAPEEGEGFIDLRGISSGSMVRCPYSGHEFRLP